MLWLVALVPMASAAIVLALRPQRRGLLALLACSGLAVTLALVALAASQGWTAELPWSAALRLQASLTPLSALVAALVPAVALSVLAYAAMQEARPGLTRLVGLLLFFVGAMELLVVAADLLTLLIGWELVGACSWALIAHEWRDVEKPRAALYAFVMTRFGDLGLFIAALAAYAGAASFAYADLGRLPEPLLHLVAFGVLLSAASKSGQLPFSPWLFRAMAGPSSVSALLHAATMVAAGAYLLARLQPVLEPVAWFGPAVMTIGFTTALAGGVVALLQRGAKKLLAASTSAHFGLMFVAIGAGFPGIAVLHLVAHGFFKALLFLCSGLAIDRAGSHDLSEMHLGRAMPRVATMATIGAAALAGIPPLGAAWTKEQIVAAVETFGTVWPTAVVVAGGLSAAYAARWLWSSYGLRGDGSSGEAPARTLLGALGWLALASVLLSLVWLPAVAATLADALSLQLPQGSPVLVGASLFAVGVGALTGRYLTKRYPRLGQSGVTERLADWWQLPKAIDRSITMPVVSLAHALARLDDTVIDALPRCVGRYGRAFARSLSGLDTRVVDRGVVLTTAFAQWLSRTTSRAGEFVADGIARGPAGLVGFSAEDARRLQTGLSHHAFSFLLIGALALVVLLLATGS